VIVLPEDGLEALPGMVDLGRALRAVIRENAGLGAIYNAALIPAAALGVVPPLAAAALGLVETLAGLANAARLLRPRLSTPPRSGRSPAP
jgi:cation transport ATPase